MREASKKVMYAEHTPTTSESKSCQQTCQEGCCRCNPQAAMTHVQLRLVTFTRHLVLHTRLVDVELTLWTLKTYHLFLDTEHGSGTSLQALLLVQVARVDAGLNCQHGATNLCVAPRRSRLEPGLLSAGTLAMDETATKMVDIPHRPAGHEHRHRTARMAAEQHVQASTAQLQTLTRNRTSQPQTLLTGLIDMKVWRKPSKLDASAKSGWKDWELIMLSYIGQLDRNLVNAMAAASETPVVNEGVERGPGAR